VDLRTGLDLLVRIDPHAGHDHALRPERHVVADRYALVQADVGAEIARASHDRSLDERAATDVGRAVDDRARGPRSLAQRHARREHRVRTDAGPGRDTAVAPDEGRPLDGVEILDLHALAEPDVPAQANARDA